MTELDGRSFESEVLRVARALWPEAEIAGSAMIDGRERDGVFEMEDVIHVLEFTTERTVRKIEKDLTKIRGLQVKFANRGKPVVGWAITQREPTADQRGCLKKNDQINLVSIDSFRARLIDAGDYLNAREGVPFGSARNPRSGALDFEYKDFVEPMLYARELTESIDVDEVVGRVAASQRILLLADYGMGKSMLLRDVFRRRAAAYRQGEAIRFPLHINLRDHQGQTDPMELITRHARLIGFSRPSQLVRAWRAGIVDLLLDGFDEIGTLGWTAENRRMREVRRRSVEVVRKLVRDTPSSCSVLLSGRPHFFDSDSEIDTALGTSRFDLRCEILPFDDEKINQLLERFGWAGSVPAWMPARPLLLSYLAVNHLAQEVNSIGLDLSPAEAWDSLLGMICEREAEIEAGIDGVVVRRVLERVASLARSRSDGLGPVVFEDLRAVFSDVTGYEPDELAVVLLQRLPGLGMPDSQNGGRRFVDEALCDTARAGDILRLVDDPYTQSHDQTWRWSMGQLGVDVAAVQSRRDPKFPAKVCVALERLCVESARSVAASDLVRIAAATETSTSTGHTISIREVALPSFDWGSSDADLRNVRFVDSTVDRLILAFDSDSDERIPAFKSCLIGEIEGRLSRSDLPDGRFDDCEIGSFADSSATTGAILDLPLPTGVRILMTVLKKVYHQSGGGRKEGALRRGLSPDDRGQVAEVLEIAQGQNLLAVQRSSDQRVYMPVRGSVERANGILDSPATSQDLAVEACRNL